MFQRFEFDFDLSYRLPALLFGVRPTTAYTDVDDEDLHVRFGPWRLRTSLANISGCEQTHRFAFLKTAGPPRLSLADRGVTFATNGRRAVCVRFHEPVAAIERSGRLRHPGATLTVADPAALIAALEEG